MNKLAAAALAAEAAPRRSALWSSAFRPFFLLGAIYGVFLMLAAAGAALAWWALPVHGISLYAWHGHEIVFGFAAALIVGIVLTALPSWAHTAEIDGGRLQLLAACWLLGRLAWFLPLPAALLAACDSALYLLLGWLLVPQLLAVKNRNFLMLLPVIAGLLAANLGFHFAWASNDAALASLALRLAIYSIVLLFVMKSGVFTPVFTGNALRDTGRGEQAAFLPWLDRLAAGSVILLALADLAALAAPLVAGCAALAAAVHTLRWLRWRGWLTLDVPLLAMMHAAYLWLIATFLIHAWTALGGGPADAWLHAFTVGALSIMLISMLARVSLRHTGRPLQVGPALRLAFGAMFLAAPLRLLVAGQILPQTWLAASLALWTASLFIFICNCGYMLLTPSLPARRKLR